VLCEKPLSMTAHEGRLLLAARERTGTLVGEAFRGRSHPQWHAVRDIIASGRIGPLRLMIAQFSYYRRDPDDVRSRVEWGGGVLLDIGCYPITMARWLFGAEPDAVIGTLERDPDFGVDRVACGLVNFPTGQLSFTVAGQLVHHQRVQLLGTRGRIEVEIPWNAPATRDCRILVDDGRDLAGSGVEVVTIPAADQYVLQGDAFSAAIRGAGQVPVPLEDALGNMAVIDALFRSAASGDWERPTA
jgi:predicted dehydrogenase